MKFKGKDFSVKITGWGKRCAALRFHLKGLSEDLLEKAREIARLQEIGAHSDDSKSFDEAETLQEKWDAEVFPMFESMLEDVPQAEMAAIREEVGETRRNKDFANALLEGFGMSSLTQVFKEDGEEVVEYEIGR